MEYITFARVEEPAVEVLGVVEVDADFEDGVAGYAKVAAEGGHEVLIGMGDYFLCSKVFSSRKFAMTKRHPCRIEDTVVVKVIDLRLFRFAHFKCAHVLGLQQRENIDACHHTEHGIKHTAG